MGTSRNGKNKKDDRQQQSHNLNYMRTIAIIPARGNSKGIPNKNLQMIGGRTLLEITINHALQCKHIDVVYVSTEDDEIRREAKKSNALVIERPPKLSQDDTSTEEVISHALTQIERPDIIVLLQCTSPFRSPGQLDDALSQFKSSDCDSMASVVPFHGHLWGRQQKKKWLQLYKTRRRRQDLEKEFFVETGSFYIFSTRVFEEYNNRIGKNPECYVVPSHDALEIDSPWDLEVARSIANNPFERQNRLKKLGLLGS